MNPATSTASSVADNDEQFIDRVFVSARSQNGWLDRDVPDSLLRAVWELAKWGPTSANCSPMRIVFVRSKEARDRLARMVSTGNIAKVRQAPVTAILGYDLKFYRHLTWLFPHNPGVQDGFSDPDNREHTFMTAFRNGSLQGAYFMLAARALGLDCGPLSGFDQARVDAEYWSDTSVRTNFLCSVGYGDPARLFPRHPRFEFDDVSTFC